MKLGSRRFRCTPIVAYTNDCNLVRNHICDRPDCNRTLVVPTAAVVLDRLRMILLITTCAGRTSRGAREPGYLGRLLRQIDTSGWKGRRLLISDGPPPLLTAWPVAASARREGQKKT